MKTPAGGGLTAATTVARRGGITGGRCAAEPAATDRASSMVASCGAPRSEGGLPSGALTAGTPNVIGGDLFRVIGANARRTGTTLCAICGGGAGAERVAGTLAKSSGVATGLPRTVGVLVVVTRGVGIASMIWPRTTGSPLSGVASTSVACTTGASIIIGAAEVRSELS